MVDFVEGFFDAGAIFFGEDSAVDEEFDSAVGVGSATEGSVCVDGHLGGFLFVFDHYCGVDWIDIIHNTRMCMIQAKSSINMLS